MQTIQINPRLWSIYSARIDEDRTLVFGETMKVKDAEWDDLQTRRTRQHSSRHQTFILLADAPPPPEKVAVRLEDLPTLGVKDLRRAAETLDLKTSGTKAELLGRITKHLKA